MDKLKFLENLTEARKKRGYTQKELATALGISDKTYSKWETGENEPDIDALCRLAEFYGESPAAFFLEGEDDSPLAGMGAAEAADTCFRRITDLLLGLRSAEYPPADAPAEDLPTPEMPRALVMPDSERNIWHYAWRDQLALIAAGTDANLCMLMLPHEERYRWLMTAADGLEEFFRLLGLPGAAKCLYAMLTEKPGSLFTAKYLAEKAEVTEAEAAAFLASAELWQITARHPYYDSEGPGVIYSGAITAQLLGLLTLGKTLLSGNPQWEPRGLMVSGNGRVNLPPLPGIFVNLPTEKGETT